MGAKGRDVQKLVEQALGSVGRLRILRALASGEDASQTRYGLKKITGLKAVDVRKHLKLLVESGWVQEHDYNPPVYTLNPNNPGTKDLVEFFKKIGYL